MDTEKNQESGKEPGKYEKEKKGREKPRKVKKNCFLLSQSSLLVPFHALQSHFISPILSKSSIIAYYS